MQNLLRYSLSAQIGRVIAHFLDAWDEVRPPKDDYERWLMRPTPNRQGTASDVREQVRPAPEVQYQTKT